MKDLLSRTGIYGQIILRPWQVGQVRFSEVCTVRGSLTKEEFDSKYGILVDQFSIELDDAKAIFDNQKDDPPLHKNQPPTAGRLKWANELLRRIQEPRQRFNLITNPILESEEAKLVFAKYEQMVEIIQLYKGEQYKQWTDKVDEDCQFNLRRVFELMILALPLIG